MFTPVLAQNKGSGDSSSAGVDPNLMRLLKELDSSLAASARAMGTKATVNLEDDLNFYGLWI